MARFDMQKWQNKESLIERLPPALLFATSYDFSFFRLTRLFHLTQELLYGRPQKNNEKHNTEYLKKKESEAKGTHYI